MASNWPCTPPQPHQHEDHWNPLLLGLPAARTRQEPQHPRVESVIFDYTAGLEHTSVGIDAPALRTRPRTPNAIRTRAPERPPSKRGIYNIIELRRRCVDRATLLNHFCMHACLVWKLPPLRSTFTCMHSLLFTFSLSTLAGTGNGRLRTRQCTNSAR